jgi:hypothetical protein
MLGPLKIPTTSGLPEVAIAVEEGRHMILKKFMIGVYVNMGERKYTGLS